MKSDDTNPAAAPAMPSLRERYVERYRWYLLMSVMVGTMSSIMSSTREMNQGFTR